jgi:hypothetical protein
MAITHFIHDTFSLGMTTSCCRYCGQLVAASFMPDRIQKAEQEHCCEQTRRPYQPDLDFEENKESSLP